MKSTNGRVIYEQNSKNSNAGRKIIGTFLLALKIEFGCEESEGTTWKP